MQSIGYEVIVIALILLILLYIGVKLVSSPIQWVMKLMVNSIVAVAFLCILRVIGEFWDYSLPINIITVLTIAVLGIPGLILVAVLNFLFI